ncbi:MAG: nucleoside phosphorylase [Rhizobiaceae bacterium]|nr:nucleoside phosphorylase [Rhizobiaceae bacterium]
MNSRAAPTALHPFTNGRPPHLPCGPGDICEDVLVPGDPDRVTLLARMLDGVTDFGRRREFAVVSGRYNGHPLTICSSGIGGPSTEIALVELAMLGAKRVIRIGGMSALLKDIPTGSYVVADKAIGMSGVAPLYWTAADELRSDPGLCSALFAAARDKGLAVRTGMIATSDSYYLGQDRPVPSVDDLETSFLDRFRSRGAIGIDMESQVILAVSQRIGLKAACVLGVHGNRATDDWLVDYEPTQRNLLHIAGNALIRIQSETSKEKE